MKPALSSLLRRILRLPAREQAMRGILLCWTVERDGQTVCRIHSQGERTDMFWRHYTARTVRGGPPAEVLSDDAYWADCRFVFRHETLALVYDLVIVRAVGDLQLSIRGLPDLVTVDQLELASRPADGSGPAAAGAQDPR